MFKRAVVTHVSDTIEVRVPLVDIVHIGTVVLLIQYAWGTLKNTQSKYIIFMTTWIRIMNPRCKIRQVHHTVQLFTFYILLSLALTISINVHSTGVSLSIIICICLVWVTVVGAVVTAVTHIITVIVKLPGVVNERTVVLFQK